MNYLPNRRKKENIFLKIGLGIFVLALLFYFRASISNGLSYAAHGVFRSVLTFGNNVGEKLTNASYFFSSKKSLLRENENLKSQLNEMSAKVLNYSSLLDENDKLKEILGRAETEQMILAGILSKPNQSPYDTLVIDVGKKHGITAGQKVFAFGSVPNSSKVILFSNFGEKTDVIVSNKLTRNAFSIADAGGDVYMQVIGRGGGNFEMILPRDFALEKGTKVVLPGITPYVLGIVQTIISDPRDPYQKALLVSPVNIQELKFVEVEK
jgi:cell shape-determining protein MreC